MIPFDKSKEQPRKISPLHPEVVEALIHCFQKVDGQVRGFPFSRRNPVGCDILIEDFYRWYHGLLDAPPKHSHAMSDEARQWACSNTTDPRIALSDKGEFMRLSVCDQASFPTIEQALRVCASHCEEWFSEHGEEMPKLGLVERILSSDAVSKEMTGAFAFNKGVEPPEFEVSQDFYDEPLD